MSVDKKHAIVFVFVGLLGFFLWLTWDLSLVVSQTRQPAKTYYDVPSILNVNVHVFVGASIRCWWNILMFLCCLGMCLNLKSHAFSCFDRVEIWCSTVPRQRLWGSARTTFNRAILRSIFLLSTSKLQRFCNLRLRCPPRTPEIAAISETRESNAALRSKGALKVASDVRFQAVKTSSFCGVSLDLAPSMRKALAIAIMRFWCAVFLCWDEGIFRNTVASTPAVCLKGFRLTEHGCGRQLPPSVWPGQALSDLMLQRARLAYDQTEGLIESWYKPRCRW